MDNFRKAVELRAAERTFQRTFEAEQAKRKEEEAKAAEAKRKEEEARAAEAKLKEEEAKRKEEEARARIVAHASFLIQVL